MYCEKCKKSYTQNEKFCEICGEKLVDELNGEKVVEPIASKTAEVVGSKEVTVGKATATLGAKEMLTKAIAAIVTIAVVGTAGFAGYKVYTNHKKNEEAKKMQKVEGEKETSDIQKGKQSVNKLLKNIDEDYLKNVLCILPDFTKGEGITEEQICQIAYVAANTKRMNISLGWEGEDVFPEGNIISDEDVIRIEASGEPFLYILLKPEAFSNIFEMFGEKYDKNILSKYGDYGFSVDENNIMLSITDLSGPEALIDITDVKINKDSKGEAVIIEYTRTSTYAEGPVEEEYVASIIPAENELGYKFVSNGLRKDNLELVNEEKAEEPKVSLGKIYDSLDMNLITVVLNDYAETGDLNRESMVNNFVLRLYQYSDAIDSLTGREKEIYESLEKEFVIAKDLKESGFAKKEYDYYSDYYEQNMVLRRDEFEKLVCLLSEEEVDLDELYRNDYIFSIGKDTVIANMYDMPEGNVPKLSTDLKREINEEKQQIDIECEAKSDNTNTQIKGVIVPADNKWGYRLRAVDGKYFSEGQLKQIAKDLNVPDDLDVEFEVGEKYYWDAGGIWLSSVHVMHNGEMVAGVNIDIETMEQISNIYMYSGE